MTYLAKHISTSINVPADRVYKFVSNPENLPQWASGLSASIQKSGNDWISNSPMGPVKIRFAARNKFGILDHKVTLPTGIKINNPMRVFPNNNGCELIFTLYQMPDMSEKQFLEDAILVSQDLNKLKNLLEQKLVFNE